MNLIDRKRKILLLLAAILTVALPLRGGAEDIDIFVGSSGGAGGANVLVILDNTSNWSDNAHKWANGLLQGQAELQALINLVPTLNANVNVGLMLFNNGGGNCCDGGYIRYAMQPMTTANKTALLAILNDLYNNIQASGNKVGSNASYSGALFDAFKYFGGYTSPKHALDDVAGAPQDATHFGPAVFASPSSTFYKPDPLGYTDSSYTVYAPPVAAADVCGGKNYIVFVGNTFPNTDMSPSEDMSIFLKGVNDNIRPSQYQLNQFTTKTTTNQTSLGNSSLCYANSSSGLNKCTSDNTNNPPPLCTGYDTCTCMSPSTTTGCSGGVKYTLSGGTNVTTVTPTGSTCTPGTPGCGPIRWADEWTNFLYRTDVNAAAGQQNVTTFTIDAFTPNKQNADQTALLYNMASYGGGQGDYYAASNQNAINFAFGDIFAKIAATNAAFASPSLPVSATNRALNANEVYIGMFRPDPDAKPLWYGNMKRYQIANFNGDFHLADASSPPQSAVDSGTGFVKDCATSFWTTDTGKYWAGIIVNPSPAGGCPQPASTPFDPYSDAPDGPKVEKGAVAEILRQGNKPSVSPTWALNRTIYTKGFVTFDTTHVTSSEMAAADVNFIRGQNIDANGIPLTYTFSDPTGTSQTTAIRSSIHGDVVHSRPQPVNYGSTGTVIYYGANDGTFRAVQGGTGAELWAYVAPEFYSRLPRLRQNSPLISYSFITSQNISPPPQPKDYYFDGSSGLYQNADNSKVWIFPTMRRGGRMIYAFDVSTPSSPSLKWKVGCPDLTDDASCTPSAAMSAIGQTWSTPNVATLKTGGTMGETPTPVIVVGGGYDGCEDGSPNATCASAKGSIIYVLDTATGNVIQSFATTGRVASDVALVDIDHDGVPDFAYVGDTRGNLYRISFGLSKTAPLAAANWTITRIAYTSGANRKFLSPPALLPAFDSATGKSYVYVALGTGDREQPLATQYPYTTPVLNRFYVYLDDVTSTTATSLDSTALCKFPSITPCVTGTLATDACGNPVVVPGSSKQGWFMDLDVCGPGAPDCVVGNVRGEQTVTSAVIVGGLLAFSTNRPNTKTNVCAPFGVASGYLVNLFSASGAIGTPSQTCGGAQSGTFAPGTGLPPSPVVANIQIGNQVQTIVIGVANISGGASSGIQTEVGFTLKPQKRNRVYWKQEGDN